MTVAKFVQPNSLTATDATVYKGELDAAIAVLAVVGTQFAPHATDTPSMSILLDAGSMLAGGSRNTQAQQAAGPFTAAAGGMQRVDRVVIDARTGVYAIVVGTEVAADPVAPVIPPGKLPVASVGPITSATTAITDAMISDERVALASAAADVQKQAYTRAQAGGTADAMTGSLAPAPAAYVAGLRWTATPPGANTATAPTWNLNALGAKTIKKRDAGGALVALAAGDYNASGPFDFQVADDGSAIVLLNPLASGGRSGASSVTLNAGTPNVTLTAASGQLQVITADVGGRSVTMPAMNTLAKQADFFKLKSVSDNPVFVKDSGGTVRDVIKAGSFSVDVLDTSGASTWFDVNSNVSGGPIDAARTALTLATTVSAVCEVLRFSDEKFLVIYIKPNGANQDFCARIVQVASATDTVTLGAETVFGSNLGSQYSYGGISAGGVNSAIVNLRYYTYDGGTSSGTSTEYLYGLTVSGTTITATAAYNLYSVSCSGGGGIGSQVVNAIHIGQDNWVVFYGGHYYGGGWNCAAQAKLIYFSAGALVANGSTYGVTGSGGTTWAVNMIRMTETKIAFAPVAYTTNAYVVLSVTPGAPPAWTSTARTGTYAAQKMPGETSDSNGGVGYYPSSINAQGLTMTPQGNIYAVSGTGSTMATAAATVSSKPPACSAYSAATATSYSNPATFMKDGAVCRLLRLDGAGGYAVHEFDDTTANLNINYSKPAVLSAYQSSNQTAGQTKIQRAFQILNAKAAVFYRTATDQLVVDIHSLTVPFKQ